MKFLLLVHVALSKPYAQWAASFDADDPIRRAGGVDCIFRAPVIGEQAAVFGMRVEDPRQVHDMLYDQKFRPIAESSGLVVGSERITVLEDGT